MKKNKNKAFNGDTYQRAVVKAILVIGFLSVGTLNFAQTEQNRFEETEQAQNEPSKATEYGSEEAKNPGNPAPSTPIDDYVPILIVAAIGLICYKGYKKSQAQ